MNKDIAAWLWRRKNHQVMKAYEEIKRYEGRHDELAAMHFDKLLAHAIKKVPYYKNVPLVGLDKISNLPIMTKSIIREKKKELLSADLGMYKHWENTSGGSTGEPVRLIQDEEYQRWVGASLHYYFKDMLGCEWPRSSKLDVWGSVDDFEKNTGSIISTVKNKLSNTVFVNAFRFGEVEMIQAIYNINRHKPDILKGYSNSLYDLACFAEQRRLYVHHPKIISTRTAMIYPKQREVIERVFGGRVFDFYGSRESSAIAGEDRDGCGKVVLEFNNIVEVVDGDILVTNLHNYSMPLIRYKIMDRAKYVEYRDKKLPILHGLDGRVFDYFQIDSKNRVHVQYVITLFFYIDELVSFQVVQHDFVNYTIYYVSRENQELPELKKIEILGKMRKALRSDIMVTWHKSSEIKRTPSGKHFYARCEIKQLCAEL